MQVNRRVGAGLAVAAVLLLTSCSAGESAPPPENPAAAANAAPVGDERGSLVSATPLGQTDIGVAFLGASATRIVYRTTDGITGGGRTASGTVFVPGGTAPAGGWPIVSVGHGTTGVADECAPSLYPNLLGTIGFVTPLLERGTVVVVTDYQGLGTEGEHPYLDRDASAFDVIDAVRAARNTVPDIGTRWGAIGTSQGGQAVWSAAERARDYGDGLELLGVAALSPVANLTKFFDPTTPQTLDRVLLVPFLVEGLRVALPDTDPADYIRGTFADNLTALTACSDLLGFSKADAGAIIDPADALPVDERARDRMASWLESIAVPTEPTDTPLFVLVGARDELVDPQWTADAVARACASGDVVAFRSEPDQGHSDLAAIGSGVDWLVERFLNRPVVNTCDPVTP